MISSCMSGKDIDSADADQHDLSALSVEDYPLCSVAAGSNVNESPPSSSLSVLLRKAPDFHFELPSDAPPQFAAADFCDREYPHQSSSGSLPQCAQTGFFYAQTAPGTTINTGTKLLVPCTDMPSTTSCSSTASISSAARTARLWGPRVRGEGPGWSTTSSRGRMATAAEGAAGFDSFYRLYHAVNSPTQDPISPTRECPVSSFESCRHTSKYQHRQQQLPQPHFNELGSFSIPSSANLHSCSSHTRYSAEQHNKQHALLGTTLPQKHSRSSVGYLAGQDFSGLRAFVLETSPRVAPSCSPVSFTAPGRAAAGRGVVLNSSSSAISSTISARTLRVSSDGPRDSSPLPQFPIQPILDDGCCPFPCGDRDASSAISRPHVASSLAVPTRHHRKCSSSSSNAIRSQHAFTPTRVAPCLQGVLKECQLLSLNDVVAAVANSNVDELAEARARLKMDVVVSPTTSNATMTGVADASQVQASIPFSAITGSCCNDRTSTSVLSSTSCCSSRNFATEHFGGCGGSVASHSIGATGDAGIVNSGVHIMMCPDPAALGSFKHSDVNTTTVTIADGRACLSTARVPSSFSNEMLLDGAVALSIAAAMTDVALRREGSTGASTAKSCDKPTSLSTEMGKMTETHLGRQNELAIGTTAITSVGKRGDNALAGECETAAAAPLHFSDPFECKVLFSSSCALHEEVDEKQSDGEGERGEQLTDMKVKTKAPGVSSPSCPAHCEGGKTWCGLTACAEERKTAARLPLKEVVASTATAMASPVLVSHRPDEAESQASGTADKDRNDLGVSSCTPAAATKPPCPEWSTSFACELDDVADLERWACRAFANRLSVYSLTTSQDEDGAAEGTEICT